MRMSLDVLLVGSLLVFAAVVSVVVVLPGLTISDKPSEDYRERTELENQGRDIYVANGCTYCHSQYVRFIDWGLGAQRADIQVSLHVLSRWQRRTAVRP